MSVEYTEAALRSGREKSDVAAPLSEKTVAVVHPAWHSCGTHQVLASQLRAYKGLGARVVSIAFMDAITHAVGVGARWRDYRAKSGELVADQRYETSTVIVDLFRTGLFKKGWWPLIHGDQATWLVELAKLAPLPKGLDPDTIDLIHANHFFVLPFVESMRRRRRIPVVLDTHDIQARQYELRNRSGFFIPPHVGYDDMLAIELAWMKRADVCIHLNAEEHAAFCRLLPLSRHELIYPSIASAAIGAGGCKALLVASNNAANYLSVRWFLAEVLPLAPETPVSIFGEIDEGIKKHDRSLYEKHRHLFAGRIANIHAAYADAAFVLLPTKEGHGLSIKTVEALSSGLPLVATSQAFRGMGIDPTQLGNVLIAGNPAGFAAAMLAHRPWTIRSDPRTSDTRALYEEKFSFLAYAARPGEVACKQIARGSSEPPAPILS